MRAATSRWSPPRSRGRIAKVPACREFHDLTDADVRWSDGEQYAHYWSDALLLNTDGLGHRRILGDARVLDAACEWIDGKSVGTRALGTFDLAPMF